MVADKMKIVYNGISINKFVRLKSKMHSMVSDDGKKNNTAKGRNTATEFIEFKDTLLNKKVIRHKMKRIQNKNHKIGTYEINKILLSFFHDKRFVLDDAIHTHKTNFLQIKNGSSKMITNKKRFLQIRKIQKDSHKKKILTDDHK